MLSAVTVATFVVRWFSAEPIASSAVRRRFVAVTFLLLPAALMMAPVSATTLTFVATTWPSVTLPEAFKRTLLFVAVMLAVLALVPLAAQLGWQVVKLADTAPANALLLFRSNRLAGALWAAACASVGLA